MNEQNQNKPKHKPDETPKNSLGETSAAKSSSGWKSLISKRWVSPAIFMAAAAIIVTLMWIYQGADQSSPTTAKTNPSEVSQGEKGKPGKDNDSQETVAGSELMKWPVMDETALKVELPFYDAKASEADREAALVQVGDTFSAHMGLDFVDPSGKTFDVLAALSGVVTHLEKHATNGNIIEITHNDGLVTVYQSVTDVKVAKGDEVQQGTIIAQAGRNDLERDLGIHLHYETRENGKAVNPSSLIIAE